MVEWFDRFERAQMISHTTITLRIYINYCSDVRWHHPVFNYCNKFKWIIFVKLLGWGRRFLWTFAVLFFGIHVLYPQLIQQVNVIHAPRTMTTINWFPFDVVAVFNITYLYSFIFTSIMLRSTTAKTHTHTHTRAPKIPKKTIRNFDKVEMRKKVFLMFRLKQ